MEFHAPRDEPSRHLAALFHRLYSTFLMIHQCYFAEPQRARLFTSPVYRGFGLYTAVNPDIARNCPELADPKNQPLLSEYGAMLHLWRNPELDPDPWIGFTSY